MPQSHNSKAEARRSPRTKRVNVFCTPAEKAALKAQAAAVDKPLNQHILDVLGVAEIDTTARREAAQEAA